MIFPHGGHNNAYSINPTDIIQIRLGLRVRVAIECCHGRKVSRDMRTVNGDYGRRGSSKFDLCTG